MTRAELEALVRAGESELQEFKLTTGQRTDAAKTLCAMLNGRGGRVFFGVHPGGVIQGQQVTDKTLEDVSNELRLIDPPVFPSIDRVPVDAGKEVIVATVSQGAAATVHLPEPWLSSGRQ